MNPPAGSGGELPALSFIVPGPPQPKQRARRGKNGQWYTPKATKQYERAVRSVGTLTCAAQVQKTKRAWTLRGRYRLTVSCAFADNRRRDLDNVAKSVSDALNGALWYDDSQVTELVVRRVEPSSLGARTLVCVELLPC